MKIKVLQGQRRVEWLKIEHPFTAISSTSIIHTNDNKGQNITLIAIV